MASLSYYGIKCQKCPAFIATKKGDLDIKKRPQVIGLLRIIAWKRRMWNARAARVQTK